MPVTPSIDEPTIPARLQRPLAAVWVSLGLHVALIVLVQVAPPAATSSGGVMIEARLVTRHAEQPDSEAPMLQPELESPDALPSIELDPSVAPSQPVGPGPSTLAPETPAAAPASGATITSPVDLTYYNARDLDVRPRALGEIVPAYPEAADLQRMSGKVRLQLKLEADGRVSDVEILSATPPNLFEDSAIQAFRDARFTPAQKNGRPVRALILIEVTFDWQGEPR